MAQTVWSTLAVLCIIGLFFPSITTSILWFNLPEKITTLFFPLRTLVYKKIKRKNDLLVSYSDIRRKNGVNGVAVIWYVFAVIAILVLLIFTLAGLTEEFVKVYSNVLYIVFIVCLLAIVLGVFVGDRQYRSRFTVSSADSNEMHMIEQQLAYEVRDRIQEEQETMMQKGMRWVIDILCTDHLADVPNPALKNTVMGPFLGIAQTNPVYMSHAVVRLLNENDEDLVFPVKRKNVFDISYTQGKTLIVFEPSYVADQIVRLVHDITQLY